MTDMSTAHYIKQEPPDTELPASHSGVFDNGTDEYQYTEVMTTSKKLKNPRLQTLLFGSKTGTHQNNVNTGTGLTYLPLTHSTKHVSGHTESNAMTSGYSETKSSALQRSHKRLSDLLSGVSSNNSFKTTSSFSSSGNNLSTPSSSLSESKKTMSRSSDKNGELLQMLLTKGPSSYVRTQEAALNSRAPQNSTNHIQSKPSSTCLKNILCGKSSSTNITKTSFTGNASTIITEISSTGNSSTNIPKTSSTSNSSTNIRNTSSPALRKMLSSSVDLTGTMLSEVIPEPSKQNIGYKPATNDKQSKTTGMSLAKGSRLDQTIRKLKAKQDLCDRDSGVVDLPENSDTSVLDKSLGCHANYPQTSPSSIDNYELHRQTSPSNIDNYECTLESSLSKVGSANTDRYTRWIDKVTASLESSRVKSNDVVREDYTSLVNLDKYKTLQKHLLASPVGPLVNSENNHEKALKRKTSNADLDLQPSKKQTLIEKGFVPEDCRQTALNGPKDDDPVKCPVIEKPLFYKCSECDKAFEHKGTLKVHERMHSMEKEEFKCDICGKVCSAKGYLGIHMRTHRLEFASSLMPDESVLPMQTVTNSNETSNNLMQICTICGKSFNEIENLFIHLRMHSGEKLYKCEICGNGFTRKTQLAIHMRIHTGEKPYECEVCGKTFRQSNGLNLHMKTHTEDKPYKCDVCGGGFGRKAHYEKHMRRHRGERPFLCGVCNKGFTDKFNLSMHMKIHSKTKDHICDICGNGYNQATHLKNHMQFHNGEKGYPCEDCGSVFEHKRSLKNHIKSDHPDQYQATVQYRKEIRNQRRRTAKQQKVVKPTESREENDSDDDLSSGEESENEEEQIKTETLDSSPDDVKMEDYHDDYDGSSLDTESCHQLSDDNIVIKQEPGYHENDVHVCQENGGTS